MSRWMVLLLVSLASMRAAETTCPWLNAATAGGVLEGSVESKVSTDAPDAACEFARRDSGANLRIEVITMGESRTQLSAFKARCTAAVEPLRSIGSDASVCAISGTSQQVAGRVRQQAFLVRVSGRFPAEKLRGKAIQVAEQVAGSLF